MPEKSRRALVDGASLLFLIKQHFLEKNESNYSNLTSNRKSAIRTICWFDGLCTHKRSVWGQLWCSRTPPLTLENVSTDIPKTLTALSNSQCLVLSGSCWVVQTEVPVPCGCPRSAETGGRLWWICWGTRDRTRASGSNLRNGGLTVNHMEKLRNFNPDKHTKQAAELSFHMRTYLLHISYYILHILHIN